MSIIRDLKMDENGWFAEGKFDSKSFFQGKRLVSGCTPNANPGSRTRNPEHKRFVLLYAT